MAHEELNRAQRIESSSDRAFGFVFASVFALIGAWPLLDGGTPRWWAIGIAAAFALVAVARPSLLSGANRVWTKFGLLLGAVVSPIVLGGLYYAVLTPLGLARRLSGRDPLRLKRDAAAPTYWIPREPPGPPPDSMTNQF